MTYTLGSLFDGIGGWPLAATKQGINPVWAAEIEPFPIEVTKKHFPTMKHLGDITGINGAEIEPVDIICMGSPCQDLSIAGKREGLAGARSGLFMDAVRIVREMREATNGKYPRFVVWENVPGAFSSNKGNDFRAVLEEITKSSIPMPESGRWAKAGMVRSNGCEVAWRTLDAQYWGVPQRRKRIFLVADFRGGRASEILFKPEGVCRDITESCSKGQGFAGASETGIKATVVRMRSGCAGGGKGALVSVDKSLTLAANTNDQTLFVPIPINDKATRYKGGGVTRNNDGSGNGLGIGRPGDPMPTLTVGDHHAVAYCVGNGQLNQAKLSEKVGALNCMHDQQAVIIPYQTKIGCLNARDYKGIGSQYVSEDKCIVEAHYKVRRITPIECERLQGLPDGYTDGGSDSARYKALGNGMAQPCADFVIRQISKVLR